MNVPNGIARKWNRLPLTHVWGYIDGGGDTLGFVARYDNGNGKKEVIPFFRQEGGKWKHGGPDTPSLLFGLDSLAFAKGDEAIYVVEGEKCAAALHSLGLPCVTSQGGSNAAGKADWSPLADADCVYFLPDNDSAGKKYAQEAAQTIRAVNPACEMSICHLKELPEKGDVVDWLQRRVADWDGYSLLPEQEREGLRKALLDEIDASCSPVVDNLNEWEPPVSLAAGTAPELPVEVLPWPFGDYAAALSESTETPVDMSLMAVLGVISVATHGAYRIKVQGSHTEILSLWLATVMEPGSRKSAVLNMARAPLDEREQRRAEEMAPEIARAIQRREAAEVRIAGVRNRLKRAENDEARELEATLQRLRGETREVPVVPRLTSADVTPEGLAKLKSEHGGAMAIMADEGGAFENAAGRYSSGHANFDVYNQGQTGSRVVLDRKNSGSIAIPEARLAFLVAVQMDVLSSLMEKKTAQRRGFLDRFLYAVPESLIGERTFDKPDVPGELRAAYHAAVIDLADAAHQTRKDDRPVIALSTDAVQAYRDFVLGLERRCGDGADLQNLRGWVSKLQGTVARIAGTLHVARHASNEPLPGEVSREDMLGGVRLAEALVDHAKVAFRQMRTDPASQDAEAVLAWIGRKGLTEFTKRDCQKGLQSRFGNVKATERALQALEDHGYVRLLPTMSGPKGGRPSVRYEVNPAALVDDR